jgi:hypothetical protein
LHHLYIQAESLTLRQRPKRLKVNNCNIFRTRHQWRIFRLVDAEPIIPRAKPGIFASVWIAVPPQVAKSDLLDRIRAAPPRPAASRPARLLGTSDKVADPGCLELPTH